MAKKPGIPKGTRDFNPEQVSKRNYIFSTIKSSFERFGFQPIETPSFENSETLMGKYGDEGDRLIFKILNSGDFIEKLNHIMVKLIRKAVLFHHEVMTEHINDEKWDKEDYIKNFKLTFSKEIKKTESEYFIEEKIPNEKILFDLGWFVFSHTTPNEEMSKDFVSKTQEELEEVMIKIFADWHFRLKSIHFSEYISEKALRYDLTVPFARYVVQNQNDITFPFKRYQIQPVWRADRPQKGRFREFYQCDADVVGSKSLWQEVEFVQLYDDVFTKLNLKGVTININNRKILSGIAEIIGAKDKLIDFTVALDKLDKIGEEKVKEEMLNKGISKSGIDKLQPLFSISGTFEQQIERLKTILGSSEEGLKGIEELEFIDKAISELKLQSAKLQLDVTLARGLNYYTGAIFEVSALDSVQMGSIGGGGRYDDLTGIFGMKDVSGVGISFGLDRIYLVLEELNLFPETVTNKVDVLFINFGNQEALYCLKAIKTLREFNITAELYPDAAKLKKQMTYANKLEINYVVLVGANEVSKNVYTLKNMQSGDQQEINLDQLKRILNKKP